MRRQSFATVLIGKNILVREGIAQILRAEHFRILVYCGPVLRHSAEPIQAANFRSARSDQAGIDRLAPGLGYDIGAGRRARFRCSDWRTRRVRFAALRWCRRFSPTAGSPSRSHGEVDSDRHFGRVRLLPPTLEATMQTVADRPEAPTAIRTDLGAIFVSLELSRSTWLITSLSPGGGEKMSKQVVRGGDVAGLLERFARLRDARC